MINTSNEFKNYIYEARYYTLKATLILADNTTLNIDDDDIMQNGMSFTDSTSNDGVFEIGAAIINSHTLTLNNFENKFSKYDFTDAVIIPYVGLELSETIEYLLKGIYTVDTAQAVGNTIILNTLDNMNKFDTAFSDVTITFPCTTLKLLQTVCTYCGVSLATTSFLNSNSVISTRPIDEAITCREIISWIAQISGNFARVNRYGTLELKWYDIETLEKELKIDGGTFDTTTESSYQSGDNVDGGDFSFTETTDYDGGTFIDMNKFHHIYDLFSSQISTDDIVITGIQVVPMEEGTAPILFGTPGYVISIENNQLIQNTTQASIVANSVGAKIVGMKFRPYSVTALSDPRIEAGDIVKLTDSRGNTYLSLVTNIDYTVGENETIDCDAETPSKNNSTKYTEATKAIVEARKIAKQELTTYDLTAQQLTNLITGGFGLFKSELEDDNGGKIYYIHDQPTLEESSVRWFMTSEGMLEQKKISGVWTTVAGTDKEGNALFNVLTAKGINAEWINVGTLRGIRIEATEGTIANMDIGQYGLSKTYTDAQDTYTGELSLQNKGFNLSFYNLLNTIGAGINVYYNDENEPILNLYARNENGLDNSNILFNGVAFLDNISSLQTRISKMENFLIANMGYEG